MDMSLLHSLPNEPLQIAYTMLDMLPQINFGIVNITGLYFDDDFKELFSIFF